VQTTAAGHPLLACLKKLEFTKEAIAKWAHKSLCASAEVVSDGLWCFQAVIATGATHERTVTGGGAASVKLEQFRAVNTMLGNLKTAFARTYHSFNFAVRRACHAISSFGCPGCDASRYADASSSA
jgi:hypothetical protein